VIGDAGGPQVSRIWLIFSWRAGSVPTVQHDEIVKRARWKRAHIRRAHDAALGDRVIAAKQRDFAATGATKLGPVRVRASLARQVVGPIFEDASVGAAFSRNLVIVGDSLEMDRHALLVARIPSRRA